jgi:hypothetical protein
MAKEESLQTARKETQQRIKKPWTDVQEEM